MFVVDVVRNHVTLQNENGFVVHVLCKLGRFCLKKTCVKLLFSKKFGLYDSFNLCVD